MFNFKHYEENMDWGCLITDDADIELRREGK
jgi:hypothetical protein